MIFLGIDPGKNGGIAQIWEHDGEQRVTVVPFDEEKLCQMTNALDSIPEQVMCVVEKVNAMPGQGVVSMFNFGKNYGFIQGVLSARKIPFQLVPPQTWKKEFSCTTDKNTSIEVAKRLFPSVSLLATERCTKPHDGMAESLLMAEYARRKMA